MKPTRWDLLLAATLLAAVAVTGWGVLGRSSSGGPTYDRVGVELDAGLPPVRAHDHNSWHSPDCEWCE